MTQDVSNFFEKGEMVNEGRGFVDWGWGGRYVLFISERNFCLGIPFLFCKGETQILLVRVETRNHPTETGYSE